MQHLLRAAVCIVVLLACATADARADLVTDRPDFTESTESILRGVWQFETGVSWFDVEPDEALVLPETLIRTGLAERWELRLGLPDFVDVGEQSGITDASLGVKFAIGSVGPGDLALIGEVSVPTGDEEFSTDSYDPTAILIYGQELADGWSLGSQLGVSSLSVGDEDLIVVAPTLVFGREFRPGWGVFYELAAEVPDTGASSVVFHTGVTWAHRANGQWDAHVASGLTSAAPDLQIGVGYSFAF